MGIEDKYGLSGPEVADHRPEVECMGSTSAWRLRSSKLRFVNFLVTCIISNPSNSNTYDSGT